MESLKRKSDHEDIEDNDNISNSSQINLSLPQKRYYRQRAHSNPIADHCFNYPITPEDIDWTQYYPNYVPTDRVEFADVGCGYGGLLVQLSQMFPSKFMIGMEIRVKVCDFVSDRIKALRCQNAGKYQNIAVIRTNAMKYLPNYFGRGQLTKMFFLFPDPHFKKQKHKWRIISQQLLSEYAYCLSLGAIVYTATDVQQLHQWMVKHFNDHPLFEQLSQSDIDTDPIVPILFDCTEEGQKVTRNGGDKFLGVFRRIDDHYQRHD